MVPEYAVRDLEVLDRIRYLDAGARERGGDGTGIERAPFDFQPVSCRSCDNA